MPANMLLMHQISPNVLMVSLFFANAYSKLDISIDLRYKFKKRTVYKANLAQHGAKKVDFDKLWY